MGSKQKTVFSNMAKSMKKAMKSMKKKSAMKSMKKSMKKAKRVSKIARGRGAKARVFKGTKAATSGGLKKSDIIKNKAGKFVSKKASIRAKKTFQSNGLAKWIKACTAARKALGIKGMQVVGGKTAKGQALLKKARSLFKK